MPIVIIPLLKLVFYRKRSYFVLNKIKRWPISLVIFFLNLPSGTKEGGCEEDKKEGRKEGRREGGGEGRKPITHTTGSALRLMGKQPHYHHCQAKVPETSDSTCAQGYVHMEQVMASFLH